MAGKIKNEILLSEEEKRYVIFPIKHDEIWKMYKKAEANFWTAEEIDLSKDLNDFNDRLIQSPSSRHSLGDATLPWRRACKINESRRSSLRSGPGLRGS